MDRRVKYTKMVIEEAFMDLLEKKDITKITVMELCTLADINRATFYRYYIDIFDLLEKMEQSFVEEFKNSYQNYDYNHNKLYDYILAFLQACLKNKKFVKVLFTKKQHINFLNDILEDTYIRCKEKWEHDIPNINIEREEYASAYIFNGAIGVVNFWIQNDFAEDIEKIATMIRDLCYYGTNYFIYEQGKNKL